jgi:hypothetical protein
MINKQQEMYQQLVHETEHLTEFDATFWHLYSNFGTWQFWIIFIMLIAPLVILYFTIDRRRILLLGFYGFNIHTWFGYIDNSGVRAGWWGYPFHLFPYLSNFALDASLVPVAFMLVYQWTIRHRKNFYLFSFILSAFFAFILKPIMVQFHFFVLGDKLRYVDLFILYCVVFIVARMITSLFLFMGKKDEAF